MNIAPYRNLFLTIAGSLGLSAASQAAVLNLAESASATGLNPIVSLNQGSAGGIRDGIMNNWGGAVTSPRIFSGATNLQPYMTWSSTQSVSSVRVWRDTPLTGGTYTQIYVDVLNAGGNPAVNGDWTQVYDSGSITSTQFLDMDLGGSYNTTGIRVRTNIGSAGDINVGEVAAFGGQPGTLSSYRIFPTTTTASSVQGANVASLASNNVWQNSLWVGAAPGTNPGNEYFLDLNFSTGTTLNAASLSFVQGAGFAQLATGTFKLQYSTIGSSSFLDIGTYSISGTRQQYYYDFGSTLSNVDVLRFWADETSYSSLGPGVSEFEAFNVVPEPSTALLSVLGIGLVLLRPRRHAHSVA